MKPIRLNSFVFIAYVLAVFFIIIRNYFSPWGDVFNNGGNYSYYNNYLIFRQSFGHLLASVNLYIPYPAEYFDLYKYPPFFALLMAPFYVVPVWLGYSIWTGLNLFLPLIGLRNLGLLNSSKGLIISLLILSESITAALNSQSNGIVIGLLLLSFSLVIQGRTLNAVILIWLSAFIKIFGGLFFVIFLCFPKQISKAFIYSIVVGLFFVFIPAVFGGFDALFQHYADWRNLLKNDFSFHVKYSVMGWLKAWFGFNISKNLILIIGLILQMTPLLIQWKYRTKVSFYWPYLISIMIWMVVFNHMAESATYVIAIVPIAMWYAFQDRLTIFEWVVGVAIILFTILGPTDLYPAPWRRLIVETYQLKAFPCIMFWFYLVVKSMIPNALEDRSLEENAVAFREIKS